MEDALLPAIRECLGDLAESVSEHVAPIKFTGDLIKIASSIPDRSLFHKIGIFLNAVPSEKKEAFTKNTASDEGTRKKVAEYLLVYLNQMDESEKAKILAKVFCAYADGRIQLEPLRRLASSINAAFIADLEHIAKSPPLILNEYLLNLLRSGLSRPMTTPLISNDPAFELSHNLQ